MTWLRPFLLGIFTENVKTKFMALTLSIVLFATVQETLVGTRHLDKVTLVFRLSEKLQDTWAILENQIVIRDLTIKGLRSVVDSIATDIERASEIDITVDEDFLARHPGPTIRLDPDFLRAENVPGARLDTIELAQEPPSLRLDSYARAALTLVVSPEAEARLRLSDAAAYEATGADRQKLEARFSIPNIVIRAPSEAFAAPAEDIKTLYITPGEIEKQLALQPRVESKTTVALPVVDVNWEQSGINGKLLEYVKIESPDAMAADLLVHRLEILVDVQPRFKTADFKVPISFKTNVATSDLLSQYAFYAYDGFRSLEVEDLQRGRTDKLSLRFAQGIEAAAIEDRLQLVIDFTGVQEQTAEIRVPVYLSVRDPSFRDLLRNVSLQATANNRPQVAVFQKK